MAVCLVGRKKTDQAPSGVGSASDRSAYDKCLWGLLRCNQELGNQMQIEIITPAGLSQMLPYTESNLKWAKRLFDEGLLRSWEIIK